MSNLATPQQVLDFGYDPTVIGPYLYRASVRVLGYLRGRSAATALLAASPTVPLEVAEVTCAIASRMATTPESVGMGARTEQAGAEQVTWGVEAFAGSSDLTTAEKKALDRMYPRAPVLVDVVSLLPGETA